MYIPFAVYSVNSQFTQFAVQNTESSQANIRLTFINRNGVTDLQVNDTIAALGSKNFDVRSFNQLQSTSFWQSNCAAGQCFWSGAVKIEFTNSKRLPQRQPTSTPSTPRPTALSLLERPKSMFLRSNGVAWTAPGIPGAGQSGDWVGFSTVTVQCLSSTICATCECGSLVRQAI